MPTASTPAAARSDRALSATAASRGAPLEGGLVVLEGSHAVVLEHPPDVLGQGVVGEEAVVEGHVALLELHGGRAGVPSGRVCRLVRVVPRVGRDREVPALEELLEKRGVTPFRADHVGEGTRLAQLLKDAGVQSLAVVLVLQGLGHHLLPGLVERGALAGGGRETGAAWRLA
jgi:hypothetical protein